MGRRDLIQARRGTVSEWEAENPVLGPGEPGVIFDDVTGEVVGVVWGDGVHGYLTLPASGPQASLVGVQVGSLRMAGDSYLDPNLQTAGVDEATASRIATAFGLLPTRVENIAVSGGAVRQHDSSCSFATVLQAVNPGPVAAPREADAAVVFLKWSTNDAILGSGDDTWAEWTYRCSLETAIARYRAGAVYEDTHASCGYSGAWTTVANDDGAPEGSGVSSHETNDPAAVLTITTPTDLGRFRDTVDVELGFGIQPEHGATAEVWVDGDKHGDLDVGAGPENGTWPTSGFAGQRYGYVYRLSLAVEPDPDDENAVLPHEIEVRFGATVEDPAGVLRFDYWQVVADPPPLVLVANMPQPPDPPGYWAAQGLDPTIHDRYNEWIAAVVAGFDDPAVRVVDIDTPLGGTTATWSIDSNAEFYSTDGLHPNAEGAKVIASAVIHEFAVALGSGVAASQVLGKWSGEQDPLLSPAVWHSGDGAPFGMVDDFTDANGLDAAWTEAVGYWGIDEYANAYLVSTKFLPPDISDDFTRADNALVPGGDWTVPVGKGTWGIESNTLALVADGAGNESLIVQDVGDTEQWAEVVFIEQPVSGFSGALILRYVDDQNYLALIANRTFTGYSLYKVVGGTATNVASGIVTLSSNNNGVHAEVGADNVVRIWQIRNASGSGSWGARGTLTYTITDPVLQHGGAGTKVGLGTPFTALAGSLRFDDFAAGAGNSHGIQGVVANTALLTRVGTDDATVGLRVGSNGVGSAPAFLGVMYRIQDVDNGYLLYAFPAFHTWGLAKVVAGVRTNLGAAFVASLAPGATLAVKYEGNTHTVYADGVEVASYVDATYPTGDVWGLSQVIGYDTSESRWDAALEGDVFVAGGYGHHYVDRSADGANVYVQQADGSWVGPTDITPTGLATDADITGLDTRLDAIEAIGVGAALTALGVADVALDARLDAVETNTYHRDVQVWKVGGTYVGGWVKPAWATGTAKTRIMCQGAGGGGGSGRKGASLSARTGGGGGAGGAYTEAVYDSDDLPATMEVRCGTGGNGGTAAAGDTTNGGVGVAGGASYVLADGLAGAVASAFAYAAGGAGGGAGADSVAGAAGAATTSGQFASGAGGASNAAGGAGAAGGSSVAGAGGGAGGGISNADAVNNSGAGGVNLRRSQIAAAAITAGAGGVGNVSPSTPVGIDSTSIPQSGAGASGGKATAAGAQSSGGAGARGGGGGGGSAGLNGQAAAAGGRGGDGFVVIITER